MMKESKRKVFDAQEADYAKMATREARRQKAIYQKRIDAEKQEAELAEKKKQWDYNSEDSRENKLQN